MAHCWVESSFRTRSSPNQLKWFINNFRITWKLDPISYSCDILLVLGLDRFGDFIGDQVVAPVKNCCPIICADLQARLGRQEAKWFDYEAFEGVDEFRAVANETRRITGVEAHFYQVIRRIIEAAGELSDRVVDLLSDGDEDVRSVAAEVLCSLLSSNRRGNNQPWKDLCQPQNSTSRLGRVEPECSPDPRFAGSASGPEAAFVVESQLLLPSCDASVKVRKQVIKVLGAVSAAGPEELENVLVQLIQSMAVELDRDINDSTLALASDLVTISDSKIISGKLLIIYLRLPCPPGHPTQSRILSSCRVIYPAGQWFGIQEIGHDADKWRGRPLSSGITYQGPGWINPRLWFR